MRKMLTATIVAMVLFAVGAFAATFAVNGEDVVSGADAVTQCAETAKVDFTLGAYNATEFDWPVSSVTVTFLDGAGAATNNCATTSGPASVATVAIHNTAGGAQVTGTGNVSTSSASITTLSGGPIYAGEVTEVAVLVDGVSLTVDSPR